MLLIANTTETPKGKIATEIPRVILNKETGIWEILKHMRSTFEIQSHFTMIVLYKLCKKSDPAGFVQIPNRQLWLTELECSKQHFTNALRALKKARLLEQCPGGYQLSSILPYNITYPYTYTIRFDLA
jgi:hypothetical protein